ncbi:hypothetical protein BFJ63_vAg101 [Fusarium oxysporum f. sp. narcissi]|uniref:Uncharacterized protein n=1 Tax=Fusarium oxysporum f. sp. narcissi TaxID=451672 RepID=A0A4Q2WBK1_FUSOX|nr:hypothetical protein BFJ63_vAg101 [Fusarium oxysporum f. sp. narcissi]
MAELLGIVAGGAGLASLALQLVDGGQKLRHRYKNAKGFGGNITWLSEDIELIGKQLIQLEASADDIMQEQLGPIMMERCRDRSAKVADRLANLAGDIPLNSSRRQIIRTAFRSGQWKGELNELQALVTGLKQDISQLYIIQQHLYMRNSRNSLVTVGSASSTTSVISLSTELAPHDNSPRIAMTSQHEIIQCFSCQCSCSCHKKRTISGIFWRLQYSPLGQILKACDNPACSARRYRFDLQIALYRYGIPLKATLGVDLITELGRYSLQPCLQIETVVDFNAPGFVFIDYHGRTMIDEDESFELLENLIRLFVVSFHTRETSHSVTLLQLIKYYMNHYPYNSSLLSLVALEGDFQNVTPTWEKWSMSPIAYGDDPFDLHFMRFFVALNPDFGDSPPLHASILLGSDEDFKLSLDKNAEPFEKIVNFLGQSALHISVCQPSRVAQLLAAGHQVDLSDKSGATPLMYAVSMNIPDTVIILLENGAGLFARNRFPYDVSLIVAMRGSCDSLWQIIDFVTAAYPDRIPELFPRFFPLMYCPDEGKIDALHKFGRGEGCINFWSQVISKIGSPDFTFQHGLTLMELACDPSSAKALIELGFTNFKQNDGALLKHLAWLHDLSLFQFAVAKGGDAHLYDRWGWRILDMLLHDLEECSWKDFSEILGILRFLLDRGVQVSSRDECVCNCSVGGCMPGSKWLLDTSKRGLFVWLELLEMKGKMEAAKEVSLALLRRISFNEAGLHHTCHTCHACRALCNFDLVSDIDNDRFWDIPEQIAIDQLNQEMEELAVKSHLELKIELMIRFRRIWKKKYAERWPGPNIGPTVREEIRNGRAKDLYKLVNVIRASKHPEIPEPFSSSWDFILQKELDSDPWSLNYDLELMVVKLGVGLYQYGGDQFERWLPLLTQLTDVLLADEEPRALGF